MTFDLRQQYNTVLPLPERKPVEEVDKLLTDLNTTSSINQNKYNTQLSAFNIQNPDPNAQAIINQKRDSFINAANDMVQRGDYVYMGKFLQDEANKFIQDRYIQLAGTDAKEFESQLNAIRDNQKIDPSHASTLINNANKSYKFNYDTESGVYRKTSVFRPFENPDINKQLVSLASSLKANANSTTGIKYINSEGKEVSNISDAVKNLIVKSTNGSEYVDAPRLQTFMENVLMNDSSMLGYLVQDYVVKNKEEFGNSDLSSVIQSVMNGNNPTILNKIVNNATNDLAKTLQYKQGISVKDLDNININEEDKSSKSGNTNQIYSSTITGNVNTINNDSDSLAQAAKDNQNNLVTQLRNSIFASSPTGNIPKGNGSVTEEILASDINATNDQFKSGNTQAVYDLAAQYNLSPEQTSKLFNTFDANRIQSEALDQKINYAKQAILQNNNVTGKEYIDFNITDNKEVLAIKGFLNKLGTSIEILRNKYKKPTDIQNVQDYISENKSRFNTVVDEATRKAAAARGFGNIIPDNTESDIIFDSLKKKIDNVDGVITSGLAGKIKKEIDKELKNMSSNTIGYTALSGLDFANVAPKKEDKDNLSNAAFNVREKIKYGKDLLKLDNKSIEKIQNALPEQIEPVGIIPNNVYNGKYSAVIYRYVQKPTNDNKQEVIEFVLPIDKTEGVMTSSLENYINSPRHTASVLLNAPMQYGIPKYFDSRYGYAIDISGGTEMRVISPTGETLSRNEAMDQLTEDITLKPIKDLIISEIGTVNESKEDIAKYISNSKTTIDKNLQKYVDLLINNGLLKRDASIETKLALVGRVLRNIKK